MKSFAGKIVLVTGGTSGIGRTTAEAFGREGAKVVVSGRRATEGAETVKLIQQAGGEDLFVQGDVSKAADVDNLIQTTVAKFGRLDVAFNNAGVEEEAQDFPEQTEAMFDKVMGINLKGLWWSMKAEIKQMLRQGGGAIVNNSSIAGLIGFPRNSVYVASKHAVIGLTKTAALEYAKKGIRVNAVAPGAVETDMIERFAGDPEVKKFIIGLHPIGRVGRPEEIASAVLWLSSDGAGFVTGQTLAIDGGFTTQ